MGVVAPRPEAAMILIKMFPGVESQRSLEATCAINDYGAGGA